MAWIGVEAERFFFFFFFFFSLLREDTLVFPAIEREVRAALAPILDHGAPNERLLEDRAYHAHVTVARPRRPWRRQRDGRLSALACDDLAGEWEAERAVLMESRARPRRLGRDPVRSAPAVSASGGEGGRVTEVASA